VVKKNGGRLVRRGEDVRGREGEDVNLEFGTDYALPDIFHNLVVGRVGLL
jgi:hypothetical protein